MISTSLEKALRCLATLGLLLGSLALLTCSDTSPSAPARSQHLRRSENDRNLGATTLTTTHCNTIRSQPYHAELHLVYSYLAEFAAGASSSLRGLEEAITHSVAQALDSCDFLDQPMYKVRTSGRHEISKEEFCAPLVDENTCVVATGATIVQLDGNSASVQEEAYDAIAQALSDTVLVQQFSRFVVRAEFVNPIRETLVLNPTPENGNRSTNGTVTATVAVAAASLSFIVASIFCYGFMRREMLRHPEPSVRHKARVRRQPRALVKNPLRSYRRGFVRLDELASTSHASIMAASANNWQAPLEPTQDYSPSITWSISDITSDSASLRSGVSWTTSKLARIEEEDEESEDDLESYEEGTSTESSPCADLPDSMFPVLTKSLGQVPPGRLGFAVEALEGLERSMAVAFEDCELAGCLSLDEVVEYESSVRPVSPDDTEPLPRDDTFVPISPVSDNLQVSLDDGDGSCESTDYLNIDLGLPSLQHEGKVAVAERASIHSDLGLPSIPKPPQEGVERLQATDVDNVTMDLPSLLGQPLDAVDFKAGNHDDSLSLELLFAEEQSQGETPAAKISEVLEVHVEEASESADTMPGQADTTADVGDCLLLAPTDSKEFKNTGIYMLESLSSDTLLPETGRLDDRCSVVSEDDTITS